MIGIDSSSAPFGRVQSALRRDVSAGTVSASDETAITSALGDIQARLAGTGSAGGGATASTSDAPTSMKGRVGAAIDDEVASGKLTSDQAGELKKAFEQAHAHMHGAHGMHGHHGGGRARAVAAPTDIPTTAAASSTAPASPMAAFVAQVQSAIGANGAYGAAGTGSGASPTSLFINAVG